MTATMGTAAERAVLGCLIEKPALYRDMVAVISGHHFSEPSMGLLFDSICGYVAAGGHIAAETLDMHYPEWGVNGISAADHWDWITGADRMAWHSHLYVDAVRTAWTRREGATVIGRAMTSIRQPDIDPAETLNELTRQVHDMSMAKEALHAVTLDSILLDEDLARYDWVIPQLLERHDRLILTGGEGQGKSTFVRQLLFLAAAGIHPIHVQQGWDGERVVGIQPVKSLVIDAENTARQWHRNGRWHIDRIRQEKGHPDPAANIHLALSGRINLLRADDVGAIHRMIDEHDPDIVYIGPLYRCTPGAITNDDDAAPLIAALDGIRDRGVALIVEAHSGHQIGPDGIRDVRPRGSSALMGWPEFGYGIRKDKNDQMGARYEFVPWRGNRDGRHWPVALRKGEPGTLWPWRETA
jgi:replicative DNA helicase